MNASLMILEIAVIGLGLALLMLDLWTPAEKRPQLGYLAAGGVALILIASFFINPAGAAFGGSFVLDPVAMFFKRFFLLAALIVLIISIEFSDRIPIGISEFYSLTLFALSGMMFAASANDFILVFVSLELITSTFYILTSFQRGKLLSLEAGVKYLILGAVASAFLVYGIALIFGAANATDFNAIVANKELASKPVFLFGLLLFMTGLSFKLAAFPFQIWAPDVYEGSPVPSTAFLAVGSKAAGVAILMRVLFVAVPTITVQWTHLLMLIAVLTILYGNLCAIPQRNLKRLLGYSSIANAGYLLLGVIAFNETGSSAVLFYLGGYLFAVLAAFGVICIVTRDAEDEDISTVAGLHQRSPLLAASLSFSMISLAGIPPLAGFFGKFMLLKGLLERGASQTSFQWLIAITLVGVVISFYYYLGVVRSIYWSTAADQSRIEVSTPMKASLAACIAGMLILGIYPDILLNATSQAVHLFKL